MAKAKTVQKKGSKVRDLGPHDSRVRETSNAKLAPLAEAGNADAQKELSRRQPTGSAAKAAHQAKNASRREARRDYAKLVAAGQATHSGDVRKMYGKGK